MSELVLALTATKGCAATGSVFTPSPGRGRTAALRDTTSLREVYANVPASLSLRGIKPQIKQFGRRVHAKRDFETQSHDLLSLTVHFIAQTNNTVYVPSHDPLQPGHDLCPALIASLLTQCPEKTDFQIQYNKEQKARHVFRELETYILGFC